MANLEHAEGEPKHENMSVEISAGASPDQPPEQSSIPSFAAASALLSAPYSCLVLNTHRRHVTLPPVYLSKKRSGIRGELQTQLLKFSQILKGVPLAYDNIRILGQYGDIINDSGYIHMDILADFILFQPRKGQKLLGKVNKLGVSHVGCLVHGCFNASIPKPNLVPMETWRDAGPRIGAELEFEVTALDADTVGVLLIRGRLDRTRVQELLAIGETSESSITVDQPNPSDTEANGELNLDPTDECTIKKKKKKKNKIKEETEEVADSSCIHGTGEKKKKRKKEKHLKPEEVKDEEVQVSVMEVHGSDSGYQSDKPHKKRKHEPAADITSSVGDGPEPKKSKKRKSGIEQIA
uniref:DNA-directed RNA polymerase subunit n=1 Tax=Takifugu rubripes TaxID=31033 RepID=A0A3B5KGN9_TAKRU